ncbi:hypothetical protein AAFF_G00418310 [Aldrovandia affinis]|uniref:Uncharacterized protein n=1 Tax=Aldrovandia affinis TaxID=143900 RepID=A0AAD7WJB9_9TELE|nr:hypothetical protein AAFF_G00418310 [Aldrovandia affinis]
MMAIALGFYLGVSLLCMMLVVNCTAAPKAHSVGSIPNERLPNNHQHEESLASHNSSNPNTAKPAHRGSAQVAGSPFPGWLALPRNNFCSRKVSFPLPRVMVPPPPEAFNLPRKPFHQRQVAPLPKVMVPPPPAARAFQIHTPADHPS